MRNPHYRNVVIPRHMRALAKEAQGAQVMQSDRLTPDHNCIIWDNFANDATCMPLWETYWEECDEFWTESCEAIDEAFYYGETNANVEWLTPDHVEEECLVYWDQ